MLKYGRYLLISQHDADKADRFFQRWGSATTFFSRLLPVVRTYISLPAGIAKMPFIQFCIYTFLGSFPWCFVLAYAGYTLGKHFDTLGPIFHSLDIVIVIAVVILVALYIWRHIRNDRIARAMATSAEVAKLEATQQNPWSQQSQFPPSQQWNQQQPQWGQGQFPPKQQWEQQQIQQQWNQNQSQQPPQWNQGQSQPPQWGQPQPQPQPQQQWNQPQSQPPQRWSQQQWGQGQSQPQQPRPSQAGDDDLTVWRR
jgi:hypothetical protein